MKAFYDYKGGRIVLEVPESVYLPREDSLLLAGVLDKGVSGRVLDMGCGSGFLSVLAAKMGSDVTAVDVNPEAVAATKRNAKRNGVRVRTSVSDLFGEVSGTYDVIVFNAPYLNTKDEVSGSEQWSGGLPLIKRFLAAAKPHLEPDGRIYLAASSLTGNVIELVRDESYEAEIIARKKILWEELIAVKVVRSF